MNSILRSIAVFFGAVIIFTATIESSHAIDGEVVGRVKTLQGAAYLIRAGNQIAAAVGGEVLTNDGVKTSSDSAIGISFRDNTTLSLGPDSEMTIDDFVFEPKDDKLNFAVALAQGTFVFLAGQVAALRSEAMTITTPVGTIGIRGTRFAVKIAK